MTSLLLLTEAGAVCFILLLVCVRGIANGPENLVFLYEKDVQDRVVKIGLITPERIKKNAIIASAAMLLPMAVLIPVMVYCINGARGFEQIFTQILIILLAEGLFDRLFIDGYWVGSTKAWVIPGTEDLMPYIPKKTLAAKWRSVIIGYPILSAIVAFLMSSFL